MQSKQHKIALALLSLFFCVSISAQKLSVESFKVVTNDLSARTYPRMDNNDVPCALLKVQLASAGAIFEGSVIGKVEYKTSEYWVYMPKGSKRLTVKLEGYLPLPVEFEPLESSTTYVLTITGVENGEQRQPTAVTEMKYVSFRVIPSNAILTIDNLELKSHSDPTPLQYSQHTYTVAAPYYKTKQGTFVVSKDMKDEPISITMEKEVSSLIVTSTPSNSDVFLDGKKVGVTPYNQNIEAGVHEIVIQKNGYQKETIKVDVKDSNPVSINKELSGIISVKVNTSPDGADAIIDKQVQRGVTPMTYNCPPGKYQFAFYKKGYLELKKLVEIDGTKTEYNFNLKKQYFKKSGGYIDATFQLGNLMSIGGTIGAYIHNVNIEASYLKGLTESGNVFWNSVSATPMMPTSYTYKPIHVGGKLGYGILFGNRIRFTPQVGFGVVSIKGSQKESGDTKGVSDSYVATTSISTRFHIAVTSFFGVSITPEYSFAISKGESYANLSSASTQIKGWGNGFNCRIGLNLFF